MHAVAVEPEAVGAPSGRQCATPGVGAADELRAALCPRVFRSSATERLFR